MKKMEYVEKPIGKCVRAPIRSKDSALQISKNDGAKILCVQTALSVAPYFRKKVEDDTHAAIPKAKGVNRVPK